MPAADAGNRDVVDVIDRGAFDGGCYPVGPKVQLSVLNGVPGLVWDGSTAYGLGVTPQAVLLLWSAPKHGEALQLTKMSWSGAVLSQTVVETQYTRRAAPLLVRAEGDWRAFWLRTQSSSPFTSEIRASRVTPEGALKGTPVTVVKNIGESGGARLAASTATEGTVLAWSDSREDVDCDLKSLPCRARVKAVVLAEDLSLRGEAHDLSPLYANYLDGRKFWLSAAVLGGNAAVQWIADDRLELRTLDLTTGSMAGEASVAGATDARAPSGLAISSDHLVAAWEASSSGGYASWWGAWSATAKSSLPAAKTPIPDADARWPHACGQKDGPRYLGWYTPSGTKVQSFDSELRLVGEAITVGITDPSFALACDDLGAAVHWIEARGAENVLVVQRVGCGG